MAKCLRIVNSRYLVNPLATRRALHLSRVPSDFSLTLNTHLQPIILWSARGTSIQVSLRIKASNSAHIASRQTGVVKVVFRLEGFVGRVCGSDSIWCWAGNWEDGLVR